MKHILSYVTNNSTNICLLHELLPYKMNTNTWLIFMFQIQLWLTLYFGMAGFKAELQACSNVSMLEYIQYTSHTRLPFY